MTQITMDLEKQPPQPALSIDDVLTKYPKLAKYPRWTWKSKRAWKRLRRARPFLLDKDQHTYLVDQGGRAVDLCHPGAPSTRASKLLDPKKKFER